MEGPVEHCELKESSPVTRARRHRPSETAWRRALQSPGSCSGNQLETVVAGARRGEGEDGRTDRKRGRERERAKTLARDLSPSIQGDLLVNWSPGVLSFPSLHILFVLVQAWGHWLSGGGAPFGLSEKLAPDFSSAGPLSL